MRTHLSESLLAIKTGILSSLCPQNSKDNYLCYPWRLYRLCTGPGCFFEQALEGLIKEEQDNHYDCHIEE
jgi:hypothetical protein